MRQYSDKAKIAMVQLPSYNFLAMDKELENDHPESICLAIDDDELLTENEVYWWNKQGRTLTFKILCVVTPDVERKIIARIERTHKVQFLSKLG